MQLKGKIIISGLITTKTGLHIGGSKSDLDIGGLDNSVVKNGDGKPFIPGSSLKGKLRSLLAKKEGSLAFTRNDREYKRDLKDGKKYNTDDRTYIAPIFGIPASNNMPQSYTRLFVRDASLIERSIEDICHGTYDMEFDYSDVKWENVIDRKTGAAKGGGLRQMERVPAGAEFKSEIVYDIYDDAVQVPDDSLKGLKTHLKAIADSLQLLEDDYIGGQGSRGYGKVKFAIGSDDIVLKLFLEEGYNEVKMEPTEDLNKEIFKSFKEFEARMLSLFSEEVEK